MQLRVAAVFFGCAVAGRNLRNVAIDLGSNDATDGSDSAGAGVWVPVQPEHEELFFYNPVKGLRA
jgi:hypothetical protein